MAFKCTVVTPEGQAFDEAIDQAIVPAHDGLVGIRTSRAPLLVKLGVGALQLDAASGPSRYFLVDGGVAQMKDNRLTILTTSAVAATEISAEAARTSLAEASARRITDEASFDARQHDLDRARSMSALASKK